MFTLCSRWAEIAARHYLKRVGEKKRGELERCAMY